jgi:hypothetical protein
MLKVPSRISPISIGRTLVVPVFALIDTLRARVRLQR